MWTKQPKKLKKSDSMKVTRKIMFSQTGFSLLEMMLVLLILSALAFSTIDFVGNEDNQVRFEDTRRRLDLIRRAMIGETGAVYNGQRLLSGYVADNGLLPEPDDGLLPNDESIQALLIKPVNYDSYSLKSPIFDPDPDATGINNAPAPPPGSPQVLSQPEEQLFKGYRSGSYLTPPPSNAAPAFYDGWNALGALAVPPSFGWNWTVAGIPEILTITSLGANGALGGVGIYDADIAITVSAEDWQVDASGWTVTVSNQSANDLAVALPGCVRASLLAYINDADPVNPFNWKRLTSNCIPGNGGVFGVSISDGSCLDGTDPITVGNVDGRPCPSEVQVLFPAAGGFQPSTLIPGGGHLLVLFVDDDQTPHADVVLPPGEQPCVIDPLVVVIKNCRDIAGNRITTQATFFPRVARPAATLVIR